MNTDNAKIVSTKIKVRCLKSFWENKMQCGEWRIVILNIFKTNKALRQAKRYVEEVNEINDELKKIVAEQNEVIDTLQKKLEEKG